MALAALFRTTYITCAGSSEGRFPKIWAGIYIHHTRVLMSCGLGLYGVRSIKCPSTE